MALRNVLVALISVCILCCSAAPSKEDGQKFLEENRNKEGVVQLASGLQYKILRAGEGKFHPKKSTSCDCHYAGTLIDGTEFDSSYKRGAPTAFAPSQVIKGWTEAMQLMVEGDKWELFIPPDMAYGERGAGRDIPGGSTLIFTMELLKIKGDKVPANPDPSDATAGSGAKTSSEHPEGSHPSQTIKNLRLNKLYSWNIFRYIGDSLHLGGIFIFFLTVGKNSGMMGFSKSTQIIYCTIYCTRYLDLFTDNGGQALYLVVFKVIYIVTSILILIIFWRLGKSYEAHKDTAPIAVIYGPCILAAFLLADDYSFVEMSWTLSQFLEGFAMVPQYIFCYRDSGARDAGVSVYVIAVGGYRVFYVLNWIYKKLNIPHYHDSISWMGGIIEVLFFIDFLIYRFTGNSMLRTFVLGLDEKVNMIQDSVEMKVLGSSRSTRHAAAADGLRRRGGTKAADEADSGV